MAPRLTRTRGLELLLRNPRLPFLLTRFVTALVLVLLTAPVFYISHTIGGIRASVSGEYDLALRVQMIQLRLERALAIERLIRLAPPGPVKDAAVRDFDDLVPSTFRLIAALSPRSIGSPDLVAAVTGFRGTAHDALAGLVAIERSQAAVGTAVAADSVLVDRMSADATAFGEANTVDRVRGIHRIGFREHAALAFGTAISVLVILLLGATVTRLLAGRRRLLIARRAENLQAERLAGAVDNIREGVAVFDAQRRLILRNPRFGRAVGIADHLTENGALYDDIARAYAEASPPLLDAACPPPGQAAIGEMRVGAQVLEVYRSAMPAGGQMLAIADVTRRVEQEAIARQAQKMEVLGRLTSGVAHDFNNLLQALSANLEILAGGRTGVPGSASGGAAPAESGAMQRRIVSALELVERGIRLTRQLLAFARRQEPDARTIDTASALGRLADLIDRTVGDRIEVTLAAEDGLRPIHVEVADFENAVLNLAINARDAMPDGGAIAIIAANVPDGEAAGIPVAAGAIRIEVADTGPGMSEAERARAMEPFYTTKPEGVGTGLGLAIVRGFAERNRGSFALLAGAVSGTRAILLLPCAASLPAVLPPHPPAPAARGEGRLILLVDDDFAVLEAVRGGLEQFGYQVVQAGDANAACHLIETAGARPDLLLTDVMMPGQVDALDLARRARALIPGLPILFNTGDIEAEAARRIPLDDRTMLLAKPWRLEDMARHLETLLRHAGEPPSRRAPEAGVGADLEGAAD